MIRTPLAKFCVLIFGLLSCLLAAESVLSANPHQIQTRHAKAANLPALSTQAPLGLPLLSLRRIPTAAGIALGKKLFFDPRLSFNNTLSCATCHIPEQGFGQYNLATPIGIEGRTVKRNSPSLYNVAYRKHLFIDGREESLEQQIWGPLLAHNEMGNPAIGVILKRLRGIAAYRQAFTRVFQQDINMVSLGMALADYERTLLSADSPFDRWYFGGDASAVSAAVKSGFDIFVLGECASCHLIDTHYSLFADNDFHDIGVGYRASISNPPQNPLESLRDLGRYEVTGLAEDRWKYQTPGLRNIAITGPYMHDGSLATLMDVIEYYDQGGEPHQGQDQRIRKLHFTESQKLDLLAFLESLTGSNVAALAEEARRLSSSEG